MSFSPATDVDRNATPRRRRAAAGTAVAALAAAMLGLGLVGPGAAQADTATTASTASVTPSTASAASASTAGTVGTTWGDETANGLATAGSQTYQADQDPGSLYTIENAIGARA